jgi:hypothetical protein
MDQISLKTPNPNCRLFLKIDQYRYLAAGIYLYRYLDIFEVYSLVLKAESPGGPLHPVDEDEDEGGDPAHQESVTHIHSISILRNLSTFSVHLNSSA